MSTQLRDAATSPTRLGMSEDVHARAADHAVTGSVIARGIPMMPSKSRRVFAAAMPASWLRWAVLADQFVDVTEHLPSEHLVDKAARRVSTALAIDLVVFWMNFRSTCSKVDRRLFACRGVGTGTSPRRAQDGQPSVSRRSVQSECCAWSRRATDPLRYTVLFAADPPFSRNIIAPIAENCSVHRLP